MCLWRSCSAGRLGVPVLLGNDADCAAVGEYLRGAGRGCRDFAVVTLGTGVGAGIILDGRSGEARPPARRGIWSPMPAESPAPAAAVAAGSSMPPLRR